MGTVVDLKILKLATFSICVDRISKAICRGREVNWLMFPVNPQANVNRHFDTVFVVVVYL